MKTMNRKRNIHIHIETVLDVIAFFFFVWVFLSVCTFAGKGDIVFVPSWNLFRFILPLLYVGA